METKRIQTKTWEINPEAVARKLEKLAKQIRQSQHLTATKQTTPYDSILSINNGVTLLNISTSQL